MAFKNSHHIYVVLQCSKCKEWEGAWSLKYFVRQLGKEYQKQKYVSQYCFRCDNDTPHVILGICEEIAKKRTPAQVFTLARRKKS